MKKRVGSCKRCGRCCQGKALLPSCTEAEKELLKEVAGEGALDKLKEHKCKHLWYKKRIARCKIYENRPPFCKAYPNVEGDLIEGCGFSFKTF